MRRKPTAPKAEVRRPRKTIEDVIAVPELAQIICDFLPHEPQKYWMTARPQRTYLPLCHVSKTFNRYFTPVLYRAVYLAPRPYHSAQRDSFRCMRGVGDWKPEHFELIHTLEFVKCERQDLEPYVKLISKCTQLRRLDFALAPGTAKTRWKKGYHFDSRFLEHVKCYPGVIPLVQTFKTSKSLQSVELLIHPDHPPPELYESDCCAKRLRINGSIPRFADLKLSDFVPKVEEIELMLQDGSFKRYEMGELPGAMRVISPPLKRLESLECLGIHITGFDHSYGLRKAWPSEWFASYLDLSSNPTTSWRYVWNSMGIEGIAASVPKLRLLHFKVSLATINDKDDPVLRSWRKAKTIVGEAKRRTKVPLRRWLSCTARRDEAGKWQHEALDKAIWEGDPDYYRLLNAREHFIP